MPWYTTDDARRDAEKQAALKAESTKIAELEAGIADRDARIDLLKKANAAWHVEIDAVTKDRDDWITSHAQLFRKIGNLLAVIHRDGGHYQSEHGLDKAIADAQDRICDTRAGLGAADELTLAAKRADA